MQGGFEVLFQVDPLNKGDKIDKSTSSYISNIRKSCKCSRCIRTENTNRRSKSNSCTISRYQDQAQARKLLSTQANLTIRDAEDHVLMSGSDIKQGSAKQEFKQETNQPTVTFKVKSKDKFKKVTEKISKNVTMSW